MKQILHDIKRGILLLTVFLFPIFFLTTTQEFYQTNKLYLIIFATLTVLLITAIQIGTNKSITFTWTKKDTFMHIVLILMGASVLLASPNKVQAILNSWFGLAGMVSLVVLYTTSLGMNFKPLRILSISAVVVAIISIVSFVSPLQFIQIPLTWQFLTSKSFTPLGSQLDLFIFLGLFAVMSIAGYYFSLTDKKTTRLLTPPNIIASLLIGLALIISVVNLTSFSTTSQDTTRNQRIFNVQLPPLSLSWYGAVETLKNPRIAILGAGIDNYSAVFTQIKTAVYSQSDLWQVNFRTSRSALLHVWTEAGIITIVALISLIVFSFATIKRNISKHSFADLIVKTSADATEMRVLAVALVYLTIIMMILPPSLTVFFLLFVIITHISITDNGKRSTTFNLKEFPATIYVLPTLIIIVVVALGIITSRTYASEYHFRKTAIAIAENDGQRAYTNQQRAIQLNPYIERYRTNFSQLNLIIANNLAGKETLTDEDRANIATAIQIAITEAKASVILNPFRSSNWDDLASVYRSLLGVAEGAEEWTISSYRRAIFLDPLNPTLRLNLGGVFYGLGNYKLAIESFERAVEIRPIMANFHYNLAWAYHQDSRHQEAVLAMQSAISLIKDRDSDDYIKATADLEEFKTNLPTPKEGPVDENLSPEELTLPTLPTDNPELKIELPQESAPPETPVEEATSEAQ